MTISTPQLYLVTPCNSPVQVWDTLKSNFEQATLANEVLLKKQYFRKEMKEETPMGVHLKEMKELTDKLSSIEAAISQEDQMVTLLGSIPPSYATLVTALEARIDYISLDYVQQALLQEEKRTGFGSESHIVPNASALVGVNRRGRIRRVPVCWRCNQSGHIQRFCQKEVNPQSDHRAKVTEVQSDSSNEGVFAASSVTPPVDSWIIDSGASSHMTPQKECFSDYIPFDTQEKVGLGDGRVVQALGTGTVYLTMLFKTSNSQGTVLRNVLYVPKLTSNLFSVRAATRMGNVVKFCQFRCWIRSMHGKLCGKGSLVGRLYELSCGRSTRDNASVATESKDVNLWHQRLGHLSRSRLESICSKEIVTGIDLTSIAGMSFCQGCVEGKMSRKPFKPVRDNRSSDRLHLIHSDVCGPMQTESLGGSKYFVTFIDNNSCCCAVYMMKHKSEVLKYFKEFEMRVTNECGHSINTLRPDNGGEYLSNEYHDLLKSKGIRHELTIPHSPQQNGVAERMNRTLLEAARSLMAHADLPKSYWGEAVSTAVYIHNRTPLTALQNSKTPYEMWYKRKPDISNLRVFGCVA